VIKQRLYRKNCDEKEDKAMVHLENSKKRYDKAMAIQR
jgi:hypothetical protein